MALTKSSPHKSETGQVAIQFLEAYQHICNQPGAPKSADLEKYLERNVHFSDNGKGVCRNLTEYIAHIEKFKKKFAHVEFTQHLDHPIFCDNKVIVNYCASVTGKNASDTCEFEIMAIAGVENNKIVSWTQVSHEKGGKQWHS